MLIPNLSTSYHHVEDLTVVLSIYKMQVKLKLREQNNFKYSGA